MIGIILKITLSFDAKKKKLVRNSFPTKWLTRYLNICHRGYLIIFPILFLNFDARKK